MEWEHIAIPSSLSLSLSLCVAFIAGVSILLNSQQHLYGIQMEIDGLNQYIIPNTYTNTAAHICITPVAFSICLSSKMELRLAQPRQL